MLVISGKTCAGKDTVVNYLVDNMGYKKLVTYTTRKPRDGEIDGVTYHFISKDEFFEKKESGFFAEYNSYVKSDEGEVYYGSAVEDYEKSDDKTVVILTPSGVKMLQAKCIKVFVAWIYVNNNVMKVRYGKREVNVNKDELLRRIKADNDDFKGFGEIADKIFYNNNGIKTSFLAESIREKYSEWMEKNK